MQAPDPLRAAPPETALAAAGPSLASSPEVEIRQVRDYETFLAMRPEWDALTGQLAAPSVFHTHAWVDAAWQWRRQDSDLQILTFHAGGILIGVAPFCHCAEYRLGMRIRALELIDIPDTQFGGLIIAPHYAEAVCHALVDWLFANRQAWDRLSMEHLSSEAETSLQLTRALRARRLAFTLLSSGSNRYIGLQGTWQDYYRTRSRRLKKGNNLVANRLKKAGAVRLEWVRDPDRAKQALAEVIRISGHSWKTQTGKTLDQPGPGAFIRRLTEHASANGQLSIWVLYLNDQAIATEYHILADGNVYALRADYDSDASDLSPGTYLNWKILESLFGHGLSRYYLGPGDNPYKLRWTETGAELQRLQAYSRSLRGRLLAFWSLRLRPLLKATYQWGQRVTAQTDRASR